jgi:serine/threonine protein kinase
VIRPIVFGKFVLLERISVGGMAEVYRAKLLNAPHFNRFLAIKRILPNLAADDEFIRMFIDEAKITVELNHPNICQIYELGRLEDSHYIVMEYIPGRDLLAMQNRYRRQKKIMSVSQACFITAQVAQGLDYAHRAVDSQGRPLRLIHRDVSPQNALVSYEGLIKLIDFGVAKAASKNSRTQAGVLKGKFGYMSPEQVDGDVVDHRSDIFALGTVFWELLTGRRLFHGENEFATLDMVRECNVEAPSKLNRLVPAQVESIVMQALRPNPEERYQWAGEMVRELWEFLNSCNPPYTQWHLQNWMCTNFAEDLEKEWEKLPVFQVINTIEDVRAYNQSQIDKAQEQMRAQMAAAREPLLDNFGNPIPELNDIEESPSTQVFTPEFDFKSVEAEGFEAGDTGVDRPISTGAPKLPRPPSMSFKPAGLVDTTMPTAVPDFVTAPPKPAAPASAPPASAPPALAPPAFVSPTPAPPSPPAPSLAHTAGPPPHSPTPEQKQHHSAPTEAAPRPPASMLPKLPSGDGAGETPKPENPLFMSIYQMDAFSPPPKSNTSRNVLIALIVLVALSSASFGLYWYLSTNAPESVAHQPNPLASASIVVIPDNPELVVQILDHTEKPIARFDATSPRGENGKLQASELEPGKYFVVVEHPDFETEKREVSFGQGASNVRVEMRTPKIKYAKVIVTLPDGDAELSVDGEIKEGEGTRRELMLPVDVEAEIYVRKPGYRSFASSVTPTLDSEVELEAELEKGIASVTIKSSPSAELWRMVEGEWQRIGITPQTIEGIDATQPMDVEVRKPGFETWSKQITFEDQFERSYLATLTPK